MPEHELVALLVDDNRLFLQVLVALLTERHPDLRTRSVSTGAATLAFLRRATPFTNAPRPSFVVLDFHLPDMDAPGVLAEIRAIPSFEDLPIVVLTQAWWIEDEVAALSAGATAFHAKPSRIADLRVLVESWNLMASWPFARA